MSLVTKEIQDQVSQLYIAFFGRAPEALGFAHWTQGLASGFYTPNSLAAQFGKSPEFESNYGGLTPTQQVERLYMNVLNRAGDPAGVTYWAAKVAEGLPFSEVAWEIVNTAFTGGPGVGAWDQALVVNKVAVSEYFAITLASNDGELAKTAFNGVTDDPATVTAAEDRLAGSSGTTYTLTTGVDNITGVDGNDTFNAAFRITDGGVELQTLNPLDRVDGGNGNNTLNAQLNTSVTPLQLSNIQTVNSTMTAGVTLGLANASQLTTLNDIGSSASSTYTGIAAGAALAVKDASTTALTTTFGYATTAGTQSVNLNVENLADVGADRIINIAGVETVNVTATGAASFYQLATGAAGTLTFAGASAQTVALTGATLGVSSLNGSAATGALNLTVTNQTGLAATTALSVVGGSGNDSLDVTLHTTSNILVDGGAGNDTFVLGANLAANSATAANNDTVVGGDGFDTLSATSGAFNTAATNGAAVGSVQSISGIEALTVSDALANSLILSRVQSGIEQVSLALGSDATVRSLTFDSGVAGSVRLAGTSTLGNTLTVVSAGSGTADSITITNATTATDVFNGQALAATGVETLNLNGSTTTTRVQQDVTTIGATSGTTAVNFIGNNAFVLTGAVTAGSVNASTLTGTAALTMVAGQVGVTSITGSANADVLFGRAAAATTIDGGAGNDSITGGTAADLLIGGSGNNTISGGGGNDTIRGDDGNDQITVGVGSVLVEAGAGNDLINVGTTLSSGDTIDGGEGRDTLAMSTALIADFAGVTNVEILQLDAAMTQNLARFTGTTLDTVNVSIGAGNVTLTNASAAITALGSITTTGTVSLARATNTATDAITVTGRTALGTAIAALTLNNEDTITFAQGSVGIGSVLEITSLNAIDVDSIVIVGNQNTEVTVANSNAAATGFGNGTASLTRTITIDASGAAGTVEFDGTNALGTQTLVMTGSSTAASILTGGAGNDTITMGNAATGNVTDGGLGNDVITGGTGADALLGGGGADTISGGAGADTITGGTGADLMTGGAGVDRFEQGGLALSVAQTTPSFVGATVAAGDSLTFGNGVDIVTDFTAGTGGDIFVNLFANAALPTTLIGATVADLTAATAVFFASGSYDSLTGRFTITADGVGTDTLIVQADNGNAVSDSLLTNESMVVLRGVDSDNLIAANFVI
jgi:Ca2+-binding RTX toxin-like protein